MVDARVYADSYEHGAKNFASWAQSEAASSDVKISYLDGTSAKPVETPSMPEAALSIDADKIYDDAMAYLDKAEGVNAAVAAGGKAGARIWPKIMVPPHHGV